MERLAVLHRELEACRACPNMIGPVVHGPPLMSRILLIGQAPGPHEGSLGRPFAWTAGKTLFRWMERALGVPEDVWRSHVYMSAVARCFPGKAKGGGDRRPDADEIARCRRHLAGEVAILRPALIIPVGTLAIEQVLNTNNGNAAKDAKNAKNAKRPLVEVVGVKLRGSFLGVEADIICLPHPSGASSWHKTEPGITLLDKALGLLAAHPEIKRAFGAYHGAAAAASSALGR